MINPERQEQEKIYSTRAVEDNEKTIFQDIWSEVWLEKNYANSENLKDIQEHYKLYDNFSNDYFITEKDNPVGTFRLIEGKMPLSDDFPELKFSSDKVMEMTLLTLTKEHRNSKEAMVNAIDRVKKEVIEKGFKGAVMMIDKRLFFFLKRYLKLPIEKIGPEADYEGSLCVPAFVDLEKGSDWLEKQ